MNHWCMHEFWQTGHRRFDESCTDVGTGDSGGELSKDMDIHGGTNCRSAVGSGHVYDCEVKSRRRWSHSTQERSRRFDLPTMKMIWMRNPRRGLDDLRSLCPIMSATEEDGEWIVIGQISNSVYFLRKLLLYFIVINCVMDLWLFIKLRQLFQGSAPWFHEGFCYIITLCNCRTDVKCMFLWSQSLVFILSCLIPFVNLDPFLWRSPQKMHQYTWFNDYSSNYNKTTGIRWDTVLWDHKLI